MSENFSGWELLLKTIEENINKHSDLPVVLIHYLLTKRFKWNCVGIGEDKTLTADEEGCELLPDGWNSLESKYALRYIYAGQLFILYGYCIQELMILNIFDVKATKASNIGLDLGKCVKQIKASKITDMMPNVVEIVERCANELIVPVIPIAATPVVDKKQSSIHTHWFSSNCPAISDEERRNTPLPPYNPWLPCSVVIPRSLPWLDPRIPFYHETAATFRNMHRGDLLRYNQQYPRFINYRLRHLPCCDVE